jgi:hypothetical protein
MYSIPMLTVTNENQIFLFLFVSFIILESTFFTVSSGNPLSHSAFPWGVIFRKFSRLNFGKCEVIKLTN